MANRSRAVKSIMALVSVEKERNGGGKEGRRETVGIRKVSPRIFVFKRTDYSDVLYGRGQTKESKG